MLALKLFTLLVGLVFFLLVLSQFSLVFSFYLAHFLDCLTHLLNLYICFTQVLEEDFVIVSVFQTLSLQIFDLSLLTFKQALCGLQVPLGGFLLFNQGFVLNTDLLTRLE